MTALEVNDICNDILYVILADYLGPIDRRSGRQVCKRWASLVQLPIFAIRSPIYDQTLDLLGRSTIKMYECIKLPKLINAGPNLALDMADNTIIWIKADSMIFSRFSGLDYITFNVQDQIKVLISKVPFKWAAKWHSSIPLDEQMTMVNLELAVLDLVMDCDQCDIWEWITFALAKKYIIKANGRPKSAILGPYGWERFVRWAAATNRKIKWVP
jgi:hypothetical protein